MRVVGHRMRLTQAHVERMRIPQRYWGVRLAQVPGEVQGYVEGYLRSLDEHLDRGDGLLLWGNNGVGKTSAAVLFAKEARRRGASVFFITAEGLRQAVLERQVFDEDQTVIERARSVDFLVLDDLGKEHPGETGFTERLFENLVRERCAARRVTIVTTNLPLKQGDGGSRSLSTVYIPSMLEVMKESICPIYFEGENQRNSKAVDLASRLAVG
jgi:DNA replication protein DnaC